MVSIALLTELIVIGLFLGAFYGLIAIGLSLVFGVQNVINLAHGEFVMLGAYAAFYGWALLNLSPIISLILSLPLFIRVRCLAPMAAIGTNTRQHRTHVADPHLRAGAQPAESGAARLQRELPVDKLPDRIGLDPRCRRFVELAARFRRCHRDYCHVLPIPPIQRLGKAIRATSQNPEIAKACGINTRHVRMVSFGLGAALAGAAGGIAGMLYTILPFTWGFQYLLKSFVVVVTGGLGSPVGAVIGGIGFGIVEAIGTYQLVERGDDDRIRPARRRADRASAGTVRPQ